MHDPSKVIFNFSKYELSDCEKRLHDSIRLLKMILKAIIFSKEARVVVRVLTHFYEIF